MKKVSSKDLNEIDIVTIWKPRYSNLWKFYCPVCKSDRRVPYRAKPGGFKQISQVFLTTAFLTLLTWPWFEWKGIVAIVPIWTVFEVYYRLSVRSALVCPHCGFDPYLYMVDVQKARSEMDVFWRKKFEEKGIPFPGKNGVNTVPSKVAPVKAATPVPSVSAPGKPAKS